MSSPQPTSPSHQDWLNANLRFLWTELQRLRLLLQRRVLWVRRQWSEEDLPQYRGLVISDREADALLHGTDLSAEMAFYRDHPQALEISRAVSRIESSLREQRDALRRAGLTPALDRASSLFGLGAFERDVILLCLAPEMDADFGKIYAYAQDDASRKFATPHLALSLFAGRNENWLQARQSLLPGSPLRRFCLVRLEAGPMGAALPSASPLRLEEDLIDVLLGIDRMNDQLEVYLRPLPRPLLAPGMDAVLENLLDCLREEERRASLPRVNFFGPSGSGKKALAASLASRMGLGIYELSLSEIPTEATVRLSVQRLLEREAALCQFALYLDQGNATSTEKDSQHGLYQEIADKLNVFLIMGSRERQQTVRPAIHVPLVRPAATEQKAFWRQALEDVPHRINGEFDRLVQQFDFGPSGVVQAVATARSAARLRSGAQPPEVTAEDLWHCCRHQGWQLEELAQSIIPCHDWDDIVLPPDVLRELHEIASQVAQRAKVYDHWGFGAKLSRGRGISALFAGPSGTGKTLAAEILAQDLDLSLYRIDLSGVVNKYIGETEKNLKRVFDAAEQTGAILFFDEADALFGKRSEVKDSHDRYANIEINYLLQRMEDYRGLAVLATNRKSSLDKAFLRRLRFLVDFSLPDRGQRALIWQRMFPPEAELRGVDFEALSKLEVSGGNIRNISINAAFLAAGEEKAIEMTHLMLAARREYRKIEKLALQSEFGDYFNLTEESVEREARGG